jgi:glycosyltransferase 2 family protein
LKTFFNVLKNLSLLAIGVFLFWLAVRGLDFHKVLHEVEHINYFYIFLVFIIAVLSHWFRAVRWNMLIEPLGYKVSGFHSFMAVMVGYFANLALPRMGEVTRCVVLNRTDKVPVDKLIGTVIIERLIDVLSLLVILFAALVIEFNHLKALFLDNLGKKMTDKMNSTGSLFTFQNILFGALIFLAIVLFIIFIFSKLRHTKPVKKIIGMLVGFVEGMKTIRQVKNLWMFLLVTILMWGMYYLQVYICFFGLSATYGLSPVVALSVLVMGSFGFAAPVQGGVGAYHYAVGETLRAYGLSYDAAYTFAIIAHTFQMFIIILFGGLSFLYLYLNHKKLNLLDPIESNTAETIS